MQRLINPCVSAVKRAPPHSIKRIYTLSLFLKTMTSHNSFSNPMLLTNFHLLLTTVFFFFFG
ncbi:hypothetical protein HanXRQr2_Chr08g0319401 [Helianthus annuus]|uniref:Uncharacterized protein n=1 Tax=Helianthus annuus TaxID=4232 RepID=A0A9K3IB51_HELAN|nr:hypothetical protein HanXRQr2_Chr08g0319401 [Helianthus annuus]